MEMIWITIGLAAVILELFTPTALVSVWLAFGALAGWFCAIFHLPIAIQIIACLIVSFIFVVIVRPLAVKYLRGNITATNADRLIGDIAVVTKTIKESDWGEVKIHGALWSAVSMDHERIEVNETVRITAIEGAKLLVRKQNH